LDSPSLLRALEWLYPNPLRKSVKRESSTIPKTTRKKEKLVVLQAN